jgi:hypothetical protein
MHVMVLLPKLMQRLFFEGVVIKEPCRIFGPNKQERTREERTSVFGNFIICILHHL